MLQDLSLNYMPRVPKKMVAKPWIMLSSSEQKVNLFLLVGTIRLSLNAEVLMQFPMDITE